MNPILNLIAILLMIGLAGFVIFLALCWLFPDWFDSWAGDEEVPSK